MSNKTDQELYYDFLDGKKEAFDEIVERYRKDLILFLMRYVKNYEIAEDLAQDTFLYILTSRKEYDFNCTMKTYLYTIAKCRAINYLHKKKMLPLDENYVGNQTDYQCIDDNLLKEEERKRIKEAMKKLKKEYQIVIYLRDFEKLRYQEIAKTLNKTMSQTKMLIHRARKALRKELEKDGYKCKNTIKAVITFLIVIMATIGVVYASVMTYHFIQKTGKGDISIGMESWFTLTDNEMYYKKINSYEEYLKYKSNWNSIIDMTEEQFESNFLVVIVATWRMPGIHINNITVDENALYVEVDNRLAEEEISKKEYMVSTMIDKELERENVVIKITEPPISDSNFMDLKELPKDYTIEQALEDNCIVLCDNKLMEDSEKKLNDFIEDTRNYKERYIRIVRYNTGTDGFSGTVIMDIKYKNSEYLVYMDSTRDKFPGPKEIKFVGKYHNIVKKPFLDDQILVTLERLIGLSLSIAIYYE